MMLTRRAFTGAGLAAAAAAVLAACSTPTAGGGAAGSGAPREAPFTIGVSNAFVGSEYRTQMIEDLQVVFDELKASGLVDELVMENADADTNGQIQQIRNLINAGVDAIIVDPSSSSALDAVFSEATGQGIKVYAVDQAVDSDNVMNIGISQEELGRTSAEWFAAQLSSGDTIAVVSGTAGNPATEARWAGAKPVFEQAGLVVETTVEGGWDQATGKTQAATLLATYPGLKGIWTYDGMARGVLQAVQEAGKQGQVVVAGEARYQYMEMWAQAGEGFSSVGVINPPGTAATALRFAVAELQGRTIDPARITDGHTIVLPLEPAITNENFAEAWAEIADKGSGSGDYVVDSVLTADEVDAYFTS